MAFKKDNKKDEEKTEGKSLNTEKIGETIDEPRIETDELIEEEEEITKGDIMLLFEIVDELSKELPKSEMKAAFRNAYNKITGKRLQAR